MALALFFLGGMAIAVGTEAVLPAYLVGMVLAPSFQKDPELGHRLQVVAFSILTPFYFLKAGSLVDFRAVLPKFLANSAAVTDAISHAPAVEVPVYSAINGNDGCLASSDSAVTPRRARPRRGSGSRVRRPGRRG